MPGVIDMVATIDPGEVPTIPEEDFEMHEYDPPLPPHRRPPLFDELILAARPIGFTH